MKKTFNKIAIVLTVVLFIQCSQNGKPDNFDYGSVNDEYVYTNSYFDCSLQLPKEWSIQSKEQRKEITDRGKDFVIGDNENLRSVVKASEINSANLLMAFEHELGTTVDFNPSISVIVENIKSFPGIKDGSDYLVQARRLMKQTQIEYDYLSENFKRKSINGEEFYLMEANLDLFGSKIKQVYCSTIKKGFSFNMIYSYATDEQKKVIEESINTLVFE